MRRSGVESTLSPETPSHCDEESQLATAPASGWHFGLLYTPGEDQGSCARRVLSREAAAGDSPERQLGGNEENELSRPEGPAHCQTVTRFVPVLRTSRIR